MADAERLQQKPAAAKVLPGPTPSAFEGAGVGPAQAHDRAARDRLALSTMELKRGFQAREARTIDRRQAAGERLAEAKLDSMFNQRTTYEQTAIKARANV
eukprot:scaffold123109_cov54-Phaeocystis_antarctica.AAC.1